jgi:hypothetical protein
MSCHGRANGTLSYPPSGNTAAGKVIWDDLKFLRENAL